MPDEEIAFLGQTEAIHSFSFLVLHHFQKRVIIFHVGRVKHALVVDQSKPFHGIGDADHLPVDDIGHSLSDFVDEG